MLKRMVVALGLLAAQAAIASPTLSSCGNMELSYNGDRGVSYRLKCSAGEWQLNYTGSVPGGTEPVTVQYRLEVTGPAAKYALYRDMSLPTPAKLGSTLVREAVVLDDGTLALKDCKEWGCTKYRPVGGDTQVTKATLTVPPPLESLTTERDTLKAALDTCKTELGKRADQETTINGLRKLLADSMQKEKAPSTTQAVSRAGCEAAASPTKTETTNEALAAKIDLEKVKSLLADHRLSVTEERCNLLGGKNRRKECRTEIRNGRDEVIQALKENLIKK